MKITPLRFLAILVSLTVLGGIAVFLYIQSVISENMPSLDQLENPDQYLATQIFSVDGEVIDHFAIERRVSIPLKDMPRDLINALIATEDRKFYSHWGVDIDRLMKAFFKGVFRFGFREGASTITQQLARNLFLDNQRSFERKIREAAVAVQIENFYTKKQILEMYLNTVNFGRGNYGIKVAAKSFFNKSPKQLTASECAYLIGTLKGPSIYDASVNYDKAIARRDLILGLMNEQGMISDAKMNKATGESIILRSGTSASSGKTVAPHFVEDIRRLLEHDDRFGGMGLDIYRDGLLINTTLNYKIQSYANEAVNEQLGKYQELFDKKWNWNRNKKLLASLISNAIKKRPEYKSANEAKRKQLFKKLSNDRAFVNAVKNAATTVQIGLVVMEPATGSILAMVGASPKFIKENPDWKHSLNHVSQIKRQPGSSMKPFVYSLALKNGLTPDSEVKCGPFVWKNPDTGEVWTPRSGTNDCPDSNSTMPVRRALAMSVNSVAARLITSYTSPYEVKDLLQRAGVGSGIHTVPALALGAGGEVVPLEFISAFGIFGNDGYHAAPQYINSIESSMGQLVYSHKTTSITDAVETEIAHEMTTLLQGVIDNGTASRVRRIFAGTDAAGKTGTTNDNTDAWFIGYTPQLICGIWVGFDDQRITFDVLTEDGQGGRVAAPIWGALMQKVYADPSLPYKQKRFNYRTRAESDTLAPQASIPLTN